MRPVIVYFLMGVLFSLLSCRKTDDCNCNPRHENCVGGQCLLKENVEKLGGIFIEGYNLYKGVMKDNECVDTILLDVKPNDRFGLYTKVSESWFSEPHVWNKIDSNYFHLIPYVPFCVLNGMEYSGVALVKIFRDSVEMEIRFADESAIPFDTAEVVLYK